MPVSNAYRRIVGVFASLLLAGPWFTLAGPGLGSARAAEQLELQLDGLAIPIELEQLEAWSRDPDRSRNDLAVWLNLLDRRSRQDLVQLLRAPLLLDQSFGEQLLGSWTGQQMLNEVGQLLRSSNGSSRSYGSSSSNGSNSSALLYQTLQQLLRTRKQVTTLELLRALPVERLELHLDGVLELAQQWRDQLDRQRLALQQLRFLALPRRKALPLVLANGASPLAIQRNLAVAHRSGPLPLQIWPSPKPSPGPWVVLMPGLGGSAGQLGWLAAALASWGWPVVVLDHPGSDAVAMQAALVGQRPPPGAETLPERLDDLQAVLQAQQRGELTELSVPPGQPVVLMGHSLGGLAALMAAGLKPEPGLAQRCRKALQRLPLTNLSRLLQCQLPQSLPPQPRIRQTPIAGVVAFNGFGSLLWPSQGLVSLEVPVLLVGGSLDLVTPPLSEQLDVFLPRAHPRNRLVMVEGGSHFSPVRVTRQGHALFQLGDELVGVEPRKVQQLLLQFTAEFLKGIDDPLLLSPQQRDQNGVRAYVLDPTEARRWKRQIRY